MILFIFNERSYVSTLVYSMKTGILWEFWRFRVGRTWTTSPPSTNIRKLSNDKSSINNCHLNGVRSALEFARVYSKCLIYLRCYSYTCFQLLSPFEQQHYTEWYKYNVQAHWIDQTRSAYSSAFLPLSMLCNKKVYRSFESWICLYV